MKQPKDFQIETINTAWEKLCEHGSQFVQGGVGVGKTLIGTSLARKWLEKHEDGKVILLVPSVTMGQWWKEVKEQGLPVAYYHGGGRKTADLSAGVCITTVATLHSSLYGRRARDRDPPLAPIRELAPRFAVEDLPSNLLLVIDEVDELRNGLKSVLDDCHKKGKRFETICPLVKHVHSNDGGVLGLTATPVRNSCSDMLTCAWIAQQSPKNTFGGDLQIWYDSGDPDAEELQQEFRSIYWVHVNSPTYPAFEFIEREVPWTKEEIVVYRVVSDRMIKAYDRLINHKRSRNPSSEWRETFHELQNKYFRYLLILERIMLHSSFANHKGKLTDDEIVAFSNRPSSRMQVVANDLATHPVLVGKRVLILGKYTEPLKILAMYLRRVSGRSVVSEHYGEHSRKTRDKAIDEFREAEDSVFIATWDSFGVGFSLPESHVVYWFNNPKSPGVMEQGNGRVRRPLVQDEHRWYSFNLFAGEESLDEVILGSHEKRISEIKSIVDLGSLPIKNRVSYIKVAYAGSRLPGEGEAFGDIGAVDMKKKQREVEIAERKAMKAEDGWRAPRKSRR